MDFNPRPPRGGRHRVNDRPDFLERFQSTPPARGATSAQTAPTPEPTFQSTPPARGATSLGIGMTYSILISIHAPREGGDNQQIDPCGLHGYFNPRPPRGGRPPFLFTMPGNGGFQSTPPARGATFIFLLSIDKLNISIHAPREGGDSAVALGTQIGVDFNPRPPRGGRPCARATTVCCGWYFNPRPPRGGRRRSAWHSR